MTKKGNPASLGAVIHDLFQNEKGKKGEIVERIYFSQASLSPNQKEKLVYPEGSIPLDIYVLQQNDDSLILISFIEKGDGFIYGVYFSITDQPLYDTKLLTEAKKPTPLCETATFTPHDYMEVYQDVVGTTILLGLKTSADQPYSTIQYKHHHHYYYTSMNPTEIEEPTQCYKVIGLSKNLHKL